MCWGLGYFIRQAANELLNSFPAEMGAGFVLGRKKKWGPFISIFDQSRLDKLFS
jgi:hypothetical protein